MQPEQHTEDIFSLVLPSPKRNQLHPNHQRWYRPWFVTTLVCFDPTGPRRICRFSHTALLNNMYLYTVFIPVVLEDSGLLAAFTRPSHIDSYAPGVSLSCRLPESLKTLGIYFAAYWCGAELSGAPADPNEHNCHTDFTVLLTNLPTEPIRRQVAG